MTFTKDATTVTFDGALWPLDYESMPHQNTGISEDGTVRVYDRNVTEKFIHLEIKDYHDNINNIRSFIETIIKFKKETFTFTPDSEVDVGNGDGGAITVRYWNSNFIEKQIAYHRYTYIMTLRREV